MTTIENHQYCSLEKEKTNKVLMMAYYFPPCNTGFAIRVSCFVKYLPISNWIPTVVTVDPKYYALSLSNVTPLDILDNIKMYRTKSLLPSTEGVAKTVLRSNNGIARLAYKLLSYIRRVLMIPDDKIGWIYPGLRKALQVARENDLKALFATAPPYSTLLFAALAKKMTNLPLVIDIRDNWSKDPIRSSRTGFLKKLEDQLEEWVLTSANAIVLATEASYNDYLMRFPYLKAKMYLIPNGYDDISMAEIGARYMSEPSDFIITHAGTLDSIRNPLSFLQAISESVNIEPELKHNLKIWLIGYIKTEYENEINKMNLSSIVKCFGMLPHDQCVEKLFASSVFLLIPSKGIDTAIPGKVYEYMYIGKPILCLAEDGAAKDFISSNKLGIVKHQDDVEGIRNAILDFYSKYKSGQLEIPQNEELKKRYSRRNLTLSLCQILDHITKEEISG